jgi:hypothetical protein
MRRLAVDQGRWKEFIEATPTPPPPKTVSHHGEEKEEEVYKRSFSVYLFIHVL